MKKTFSAIVALVLVVGVAWVGSSWWFSRQVESRYRQLVARAAHLSGAEIDVESYQRGLRSSTARTRIVIPAPQVKEGAFPKLEFTVINEIVSGPFPGGAAGWRPALALVHSQVALGHDLLKIVRKELPAFPDVLPLASTTIVYFGGNGESWTSAPAMRQTLGDSDPITIDWQGLKGHSTFKAGFAECRGDWQMPALEVTAKTGRLKLTGLGSTFDMHLPQGLEGLVLGNFEYGLKGLDFTDSGAEDGKGLNFALQDLALKSSSWETEGLVNAILRASFRSLTVAGAVYGPGVYDMQLTNFDGEALHEMQQLSRSLREEPGLSPQQMQTQMLAGIGKLWPRFAACSPGIEIRDLSVQGPDGHLHCTGKVAIDGSNKAALASPLLLPNAITAQASLDISAQMLRKMVAAVIREQLVKARAASGQPPLPEQRLDALAAANSDQGVTAMVEKHILVPNGDTYTLSASYQPGAATLNGQPIPLH